MRSYLYWLLRQLLEPVCADHSTVWINCSEDDDTVIRLYLLSLLDGGHGVWLELQLVCPTKFPVEDGRDDDDHEEGNHHPDDDPHVRGPSVRG